MRACAGVCRSGSEREPGAANDVSNSPMQPTALAALSSTAATTPLRRLAVASTTTCAKEASDYGKCIVATYTDVHKDTCKAEFDRFSACLRRTVSSSLLTILTYNLQLPAWVAKTQTVTFGPTTRHFHRVSFLPSFSHPTPSLCRLSLPFLYARGGKRVIEADASENLITPLSAVARSHIMNAP